MTIKPEKMVVLCPNWVGDVVMATPVFGCLRRNYPEARITGVIRKYAAGVIKDGPWFDGIIELDDKTPGGFMAGIRALRSVRPDMAIVLPNSFRSTLIAFLGGSKKRYGYKRDLRSCLLSGGPRPVKEGGGIKPVPMVEYYMAVCRYLNLALPEKTRPELYFSESIRGKGRALFERYGIQSGEMVIGLNPGAKFGASKCWPPEYFARLAEQIREKWACRVLLLVGPGEDELAASIIRSGSTEIINTGPDKVDLELLKYVVSRLDLLVTNDTGPRHYGVAYDIPTVVIMGPTNPDFTAANLEKTVVLRKNLGCSPCHEKTCPLGHHQCMTRIVPEEVLAASVKLLSGLRGFCYL